MAQFVIPPPLTKVSVIFTAATGRPLHAGVGWDAWISPPPTDLEAVRPYIRPCHQRLLNETLAGKSPLALLRQLLRPHGYRIDTEGKGWRLVGPDGVHGSHGPGCLIEWA